MEEDNISDGETVEINEEKVFDIRDRAFAFAVRIVKLCQ